MGAAALPLVLSVLGAGVGEFSNRRVARQRDRDIAAGIRKTTATQEDANRRIKQNLDLLEKSRAEPFKETLQGQFLDRIRQQRSTALAGLDTPGATSEAFKSATAEAGTGAIDYAGVLADLFSSIDAPGFQRSEEGFRAGDLGMDLSRLTRDADQDTFLARLRASRRRPSFGLGLLSAGLSGAAGAASTRGGRNVDNADFLRQAGLGG